MVFVIHWHESAMDLHVFPIPISPPPSLSTYVLNTEYGNAIALFQCYCPLLPVSLQPVFHRVKQSVITTIISHTPRGILPLRFMLASWEFLNHLNEQMPPECPWWRERWWVWGTVKVPVTLEQPPTLLNRDLSRLDAQLCCCTQTFL